MSEASGSDGREALPVEEFIHDFLAEADEHLAVIRDDLLKLEQHADPSGVDPDLIHELFRACHTLKGLSAMMGLEPAVELSHRMEGLLKKVRQGELSVTSQMIDALLVGATSLEAVINTLRGGPTPDVSAALAALDACTPSEGEEPPPPPPSPEPSPPPSPEPAPEEPRVPLPEGLELPPDIAAALTPDEAKRLNEAVARGDWISVVTFRPSAELAERGINVNSVRQRLESAGEIIKAVPRMISYGVEFAFLWATATSPTLEGEGITVTPLKRPSEPPRVEAAKPKAPPPTRAAPPTIVRVDIARLDELMHLVGELVVDRARLQENLAALRDHIPRSQWRELGEALRAMEVHLRDLRDRVMRARLVPIRDVFSRMPLAVRDLTRHNGKQVHLEMEGEDTEVDRLLVEQLMDPLLHLVRNAVIHGLENPAERQAAGKPPVGTLRLRAWPEGDWVVIQVADDGRGIAREQIAERARAMGLLPPDLPLDDARLVDILCMPGFSTRDVADTGAGRGVGLDVVQRTVLGLGGNLTLQTEPGRGTCWTLRLPLTLAIMDALLVGCGDQRFAIPLAIVNEVIEVDPARIRHVEGDGGELLPYRGGSLPLWRLNEIFQLSPRPGPLTFALVVGEGSAQAGLIVDRLHGQREIVVRPISDPLVSVPGLIGATDLGDGRAVLILDVLALLRSVRLRRNRRQVSFTQESKDAKGETHPDRG